MTPRQFEDRHGAGWSELEAGLAALDAGPQRGRTAHAGTLPAVRLARRYRAACEHLALARDRAYPVHLVARLEALTARAHQHVYRRHDYGLAALRTLVLHDIPAAVRALRWRLALAVALLGLPMVAVGLATWLDPHFLLHVVDAGQAREYEQMYGPEAAQLGRTAGDDWHMFGFYVMNNIGLAFQCFAVGLTFGVGSLLMLVWNGLLGGAIAGFLVTRGSGERFFSFVVTHAAFELTAIALAGACGLALAQALLAPGRRTRTTALRDAARATAPVMYAVFAMLVIAAAIEAFWSSAGWIAPGVKFAAGAVCWAAMLAYLGLQGRRAPRPQEPRR